MSINTLGTVRYTTYNSLRGPPAALSESHVSTLRRPQVRGVPGLLAALWRTPRSLARPTAAFFAIATAAATASVASASPPTLVTAPSVPNSGAEGQVLTDTPGTWSGASSVATQWVRCSYQSTLTSDGPSAYW